VPIGYSGHENGLAPSLAAVALGASFVERHITLDRAMWGTDQAASVELVGFERLIRNIRDIEKSLGDGVKRLYDSELEPRKSCGGCGNGAWRGLMVRYPAGFSRLFRPG
jgi:N-acetylneuraminate synthase